jgi:hypothetical protein
LWWVSAHALESVDLRLSISSLIDQLDSDDSVDELFALPESHDVVVAHATRPIIRALSGRPDLAVRLVGQSYELRSGIRFFADSVADVQGYLVDEVDDALGDASLVVVEARAASATGYLLDEAAQVVAERASDFGIPLYVLAGVGRILPVALFDAMVRHIDELERREMRRGCDEVSDAELAGLVALVRDDPASRDEAHAHIVPAERARGVITERGLRTPLVAFHRKLSVSHLRCPAPDELLAPFGLGR